MKLFSILMMSMLLSYGAWAEDRFNEVQIVSTQVNDHVFMLTGYGGNIGVSAGKDGLLIIDDQFAPLADKISQSLSQLKMGDKTFIVNTHFHGDHTGGNAKIRQIYQATIFAHDNVRARLKANEKFDSRGLPVVTYERGVKFHFNNDLIRVIHLPSGHTDGDSVIFFSEANVLHTGDLFFNGMFPFIDLKSGGSIAGFINNVAYLAEQVKADTKIIPGHGPLANKQDLKQYLAMLKQTTTDVLHRKNRGENLQEMIKNGLDKKWDSWSWSFIDSKKWITTLYNGQ